MGKFADGWESARKAHEAHEAEKRRRLETIAAALKQLSEALAEDGEALTQQDITLRMEHGALVLKHMVEPMAGVTFEPETGRFRIHTYSSGEGSSEVEAASVEECALKLGEYAYGLKT